MKRFAVLGVVGVVVLAATGCGGPDSLMKEYIANLNGLSDAIEKKESKDRVQAAADRVKATQDKIDKLKLSEGERDGLKKKYQQDLEAAVKRVLAASLKAAMEGGTEGLPRLDMLKK
jgi:phosphosulfolactate phosphohydrolase-like enzyme